MGGAKEASLEDSSNTISGDLIGSMNEESTQSENETNVVVSPPMTRNRMKGMVVKEGGIIKKGHKSHKASK